MKESKSITTYKTLCEQADKMTKIFEAKKEALRLASEHKLGLELKLKDTKDTITQLQKDFEIAQYNLDGVAKTMESVDCKIKADILSASDIHILINDIDVISKLLIDRRDKDFLKVKSDALIKLVIIDSEPINFKPISDEITAYVKTINRAGTRTQASAVDRLIDCAKQLVDYVNSEVEVVSAPVEDDAPAIEDNESVEGEVIEVENPTTEQE